MPQIKYDNEYHPYISLRNPNDPPFVQRISHHDYPGGGLQIPSQKLGRANSVDV